MNSNFKSYRKNLKKDDRKKAVVADFEVLRGKQLPPIGLEQLLKQGQKSEGLNQPVDRSTPGFDQLKAKDQALRRKMVNELEEEISKYYQLRQQKKQEEERQAQMAFEQEQAQKSQPKRPLLSISRRPKRGGAFLALGGRKKKATEMKVKRSKQEMAGGRGGD